MVKIVLSNLAKSDLKDIIDYIKRDSIKYAILEAKRIKTAIDKLSDQPDLGRVFPKLNNELYRELIHYNYSIIYKIVSSSRIEILTIHHHSRSITNNLAFTDED